MHDKDAIRQQLMTLKQELKNLSYWQPKPPPTSELASREPFACDTLKFEQWLQFLFLPKIEFLLDSGQALPTEIAMAPYGEEVYKGRSDHATLVACIADLDALLTGKPGTEASN